MQLLFPVVPDLLLIVPFVCLISIGATMLIRKIPVLNRYVTKTTLLLNKTTQRIRKSHYLDGIFGILCV